MLYDAASARRIIAGHVANLYAGLISRETAATQLRALGELCARGADPEASNACEQLAAQIGAGESPTVIFPKLGIQVGPDPDRIPTWDADTPPVTSEADVDAELEQPEATDADAELGSGQDASDGEASADPQADGDPGSEPEAEAEVAGEPLDGGEEEPSG